MGILRETVTSDVKIIICIRPFLNIQLRVQVSSGRKVKAMDFSEQLIVKMRIHHHHLLLYS